jgi:F-type H+-transporting ATPase subunit gamma
MASSNMKDIKRRIKSVSSTMQITKAMELVASSKLRKAKEKAEKVKPFFETLYETMWEISYENSTFDSIYVKNREVKNTLIVVIAGDRGLAGGFNTNVFKMAQERIKEVSQKSSVVILPIGKKSVEYFEKRNFNIVSKYDNIAENMTIYDAKEMSDKITTLFFKEKIDRVEVVFTTYVSPLVQEARYMEVLPIANISDKKLHKSQTTYEPDPKMLFDILVPKYIEGILYGSVIDSYASEQASRRIAMENASDNADEMIENLSLLYNRARQSSITQEITEIVSGAEAQN